jgi:hypothetical protein
MDVGLLCEHLLDCAHIARPAGGDKPFCQPFGFVRRGPEPQLVPFQTRFGPADDLPDVDLRFDQDPHPLLDYSTERFFQIRGKQDTPTARRTSLDARPPAAGRCTAEWWS